MSSIRQAVAMAMAVSLTTLAAGTWLADPPPADGVLQRQSKPNVVMIIVDDMRADDLRFMPRTRRLLGGQGATFANSFSPYPLCCPARASIFLGQYTHNHRVFTVAAPYAFPALKDQSTLATWLQAAGYSTVLLGKYMNGYGDLPKPGATKGKSLHYVPPGWTDWRASIEGGIPPSHSAFGNTYAYDDTTLSHQGEGFDNYQGRYQSTVYGDLSTDIIQARAASDKPFFLYASYTAPHSGGPPEPDDPRNVRDRNGNPVQILTPARADHVKGMFDDVITAAPGAYWRDPDISDKPRYLRRRLLTNRAERVALRELTRQRAEALYLVDRQVKRTIDALAASRELDETLVIFTSDNGYFLGEQGIRQGKTLPHDPSLRTPLLMRGPGIPAGEVRYDPFLSIDFAPTIADVAGATPGVPVDGVSMLDVARHGDIGWRRAVLTELGPKGLVRNTDESGLPLDVDDPGERDLRWAIGIRTDRYLYVDLATKEEELYDMATDPDQYHNLAGKSAHAELLALMREQLTRMRACDASECQASLPQQLTTAPGQSIAAGDRP